MLNHPIKPLIWGRHRAHEIEWSGLLSPERQLSSFKPNWQTWCKVTYSSVWGQHGGWRLILTSHHHLMPLNQPLPLVPSPLFSILHTLRQNKNDHVTALIKPLSLFSCTAFALWMDGATRGRTHVESRALGKRKLAQTHPEVLGKAWASPKEDRGRTFRSLQNPDSRVKDTRMVSRRWEGPSCPVQLRDPAWCGLRVCSGVILARPVPGE